MLDPFNAKFTLNTALFRPDDEGREDAMESMLITIGVLYGLLCAVFLLSILRPYRF